MVIFDRFLPLLDDLAKNNQDSNVVDLVQWAAIMLLGGLALVRRDLDRRVRWAIAALVAGFWLIHGATYIIPRYRDPVMPILIALAALEAARRLRAFAVR